MYVTRSQKFVSKVTGAPIKVTGVLRSSSKRHKDDLCAISYTHEGRVISGTSRFVLADSIRRKYQLSK